MNICPFLSSAYIKDKGRKSPEGLRDRDPSESPAAGRCFCPGLQYRQGRLCHRNCRTLPVVSRDKNNLDL